MKSKLAAVTVIAALSQVPYVSHAQNMDMDPDHNMGSEPMTVEFIWDLISPARYQLRGHDIIVLPEGGRYAVYKDGNKDKTYESLSDARLRGEHLAMAKPTMKKDKKPMMKEKPMPKKDMDDKEMNQ